MREFINVIMEAQKRLPEIVYHGTTAAQWASTEPGTLYVITDRHDAANYSSEAGESEYYEKHGHEDVIVDDPEIVHIVVEFRLADLVDLGLEFQPDWGWVEGQSTDRSTWGQPEPTWEDSLQAVGSFCIADFNHKEVGKVTPTW
jgi:hypothetical protein